MPVVILPPPVGGIVGVDGNGCCIAGGSFAPIALVSGVHVAVSCMNVVAACSEGGGVGDRDVVVVAFGVVDGTGCCTEFGDGVVGA